MSKSLLKCRDRVLAITYDGLYIRMRCRDNYCPDVIRAKEIGARAYHWWDIQTGELVRTEFEQHHLKAA